MNEKQVEAAICLSLPDHSFEGMSERHQLTRVLNHTKVLLGPNMATWSSLQGRATKVSLKA